MSINFMENQGRKGLLGSLVDPRAWGHGPQDQESEQAGRSGSRRSTELALIGLSVLVMVALLLAGCGSTSDSDSSATTDVPVAVTVPSSIPAGLTLRVGDQQEFIKNALSLAGEDQNLPYKVEYGAFVGGPPMLQAFRADELDVGFVADAPLIFAQASGQDIKGIAAWGNSRSSYSLITAPGVDSVNGWADLKGKKVAFQTGTALQGALLTGLDSVGLTQADIEVVDVPTIQIAQVLKSGGAAAGIGVWPLTESYLNDNPTARNVVEATAITDRLQFFIASGKALADDGKTAVIADFLTRFVRSLKWANANPDVVAQKTLVETYRLTLAQAKERLAANGPTVFQPLPGDLIEPQQRLTDLFVSNRIIPRAIDAASQFDSRFNSIVKVASGS